MFNFTVDYYGLYFPYGRYSKYLISCLSSTNIVCKKVDRVI